jgi:hypothetical protein
MLRVIPKRGPFIPDEPACPECAGTQLKLAILGKVHLELLTKCDEKDAEIARLSALLVSESELRLVAEASLHNLERAARKVVEALEFIAGGYTIEGWRGPNADPLLAMAQEVIHGAQVTAKTALADPVIVKLERE